MAGIPIAETMQKGQLFIPTAAPVSTGHVSDVVGMKDYTHADLVIMLSTAATAPVLTLYEADDFVPTTTTAIGFKYYNSTGANLEVNQTRATATTSGITLTQSYTYVIEVDADDLSSGAPNLYATLTGSTQASVAGLFLLSGSKYQGTLPSALS